jgi:hypothetical protein
MLVNHSIDLNRLHSAVKTTQQQPTQGENSSFNSLLDQMKLSGGPVKAKLDPPTGANLLDQMKLSGGPVKAKLDPIKGTESLAQPELSHKLSNMQQVTSIFNTRLLLQKKTFI